MVNSALPTNNNIEWLIDALPLKHNIEVLILFAMLKLTTITTIIIY